MKTVENKALMRIYRKMLTVPLKAEERNKLTTLQNKLETKYSFIKTHSIYYSELLTLYKMNSGVAQNEIELEEDNEES